MVQCKRWLLSLALAGAFVACGDEEDGTGAGDGGTQQDGDGSITGQVDSGVLDGSALIDARSGDASRDNNPQNDRDAASCSALMARVRDFKATHADFEKFSGDNKTPGLVAPTLESGKPKYTGICDDSEKPYAAPLPASCPYGQQMSTEANFAQWYSDSDIAGVNQSFEIALPLTDMGNGSFEYKSNAFFPIDGKGFGNEGMDEAGKIHNFNFTTEVRTSFTYKGGEEFTFSGDDDLWIFIDGKLALDLGGLQKVRDATIKFETLGLTVGKTYRMDIFHAERHTKASNFSIRTNIECFVDQMYL